MSRLFGEAGILEHDLAADAQAAEYQRSREARAILARDAGKDERQIAGGEPRKECRVRACEEPRQ
jgi:hypothetical protein